MTIPGIADDAAIAAEHGIEYNPPRNSKAHVLTTADIAPKRPKKAKAKKAAVKKTAKPAAKKATAKKRK